ncbi:phage portal protein, partial [Enterobacter quasiroggenkampii]|uniref:phage portal protein n=1 Tax=Enterobacter quasiroggenkampii TaxID=2497436 RepID=UPI0021D01074
SEVLHFRLLSNPESGFDGCQYVGISPLDSLANELQTKDQAQKLTLSQLKRAIMPSNLITIPEAKVDSATKDNIRSKFEEQNLSGTSSTIVMDQSATLSQIQIDKNVADFLSTLDWSTERVASAFGIPTSYI